MMNALIGKAVNEVPDTQVCMYISVNFLTKSNAAFKIGIFLRTATKTVENASNDIDICCKMLDNIITKVCDICVCVNIMEGL